MPGPQLFSLVGKNRERALYLKSRDCLDGFLQRSLQSVHFKPIWRLWWLSRVIVLPSLTISLAFLLTRIERESSKIVLAHAQLFTTRHLYTYGPSTHVYIWGGGGGGGGLRHSRDIRYQAPLQALSKRRRSLGTRLIGMVVVQESTHFKQE